MAIICEKCGKTITAARAGKHISKCKGRPDAD